MTTRVCLALAAGVAACIFIPRSPGRSSRERRSGRTISASEIRSCLGRDRRSQPQCGGPGPPPPPPPAAGAAAAWSRRRRRLRRHRPRRRLAPPSAAACGRRRRWDAGRVRRLRRGGHGPWLERPSRPRWGSDRDVCDETRSPATTLRNLVLDDGSWSPDRAVRRLGHDVRASAAFTQVRARFELVTHERDVSRVLRPWRRRAMVRGPRNRSVSRAASGTETSR